MHHHARLTQKEKQRLQMQVERTVSQPNKDDATVVTALVASIQHEHYALPITDITSVYQNAVIVPVPCAPEFVAGVTNVRGHVLSVVDLGTLLGLPRSEDTDGAALVIAETDDSSIGFRVEAIDEIVELALSSMNPITPAMNFGQAHYLRGIFPDGIALLDVSAILDDPRLADDETLN